MTSSPGADAHLERGCLHAALRDIHLLIQVVQQRSVQVHLLPNGKRNVLRLHGRWRAGYAGSAWQGHPSQLQQGIRGH